MNESDYMDTEVYDYLSNLYTYLTGDLETFHAICDTYEQRELIERNDPTKQYSNGSYGFKRIPLPPITGEQGHDTTFAPEEITTYFKSTIPYTLTLFSTIDIIGYLLGNVKPGTSGQNSPNFQRFLNNNISKDEETVLINVFRHGMTHGYFPKLDVGISSHSMNPQGKLFFLERGYLVLNVFRLEEIVIDRLNEIIGDESLYPNMETQYKGLVDYYKKKVGDSIENLRKSLV